METQLSLASHTDESMMLRMTHLPQHSRFLYNCTLVQPDAGRAKAVPTGASEGGWVAGEVAVIVEPTTQPRYLLQRGDASHVEFPRGGKYSKSNLSQVVGRSERRKALSCSVSCSVRLPWGNSALQCAKISTKSLNCLPLKPAVSWETSVNTTLTYYQLLSWYC